MKKGYKQLIAEAEAVVTNLSCSEAAEMLGREDVVFIDVRESAERRHEGIIPDAVAVPRGVIEFWVDPDSPYYNKIFAGEKKFVLYCAMGWRSVLAAKAIQDMGIENVAHVAGGFTAWQSADLPIEK